MAPPSVVVGWCDESDSFGKEIGHEWLSLWPSGRASERERAHRSWWELAEVWSEPCLPAEILVDPHIHGIGRGDQGNGRQTTTTDGPFAPGQTNQGRGQGICVRGDV